MLVALIGLFVGIALGATGVGAGMLTVPLLVMLAGKSAVESVGAALLFSMIVKTLATAGELKQFTGIDDPYEPPLAPEVESHTDLETIEECTRRILDFLYYSSYDSCSPGKISAEHGAAHREATRALGNRLWREHSCLPQRDSSRCPADQG